MQKEQLLCDLDAFVSLQREHLRQAAAGRLREIQPWRNQRQQLFGRIRKFLEGCAVDQAAAGDRDFFSDVQERIRVVLEKEKLLAAEIEKQRAALKDKMNAIRKGKTILKGYSLKKGTAPKPRFLSSKT